MAKQIAKLLKASIEDTSDLKKIAQRLAQKGRGGDSMLVHITPREAGMLKEAGGAGTINPDTGLMEFYEDTYFSPSRAGSVDVDATTYYSPRRSSTSSVPTDFGFESRQLPVSQDFPLTSPDYGQMYSTTQTSSDYSLLPRNAVPDPKTGGYVSPDMADVGGQYGLGFGRLPVGTLKVPIDPKIRLQQQAQAAAPSAPYTPGAYSTIPEVEQALKREPTILERLKQPQTLEKLGLAGLQAIPGILASRQAAAQGRRAKEELQAMAAPYKQRGETMLAQAERGELTPVEQQQLQALQARAAQGAAARGGVGAEQAQAQIEAFRQQLLANKYDMGLKVANIGDQIAAGAIKTGLSADQYVNELTNTYFTNVARSFYGQPPQVAQAQQMTPRG